MHLSIRSSVNQFVRCELNRAVFITRSHATQGEEMIFLGPSRLVLQGIPLHLAPRPREFTPGPLECRESSPEEGRKGLRTLSRSSASFHSISLVVLCPHFLPFPYTSQPSTDDADDGEKPLPQTALLCSHRRTHVLKSGDGGQPIQWSLAETSNACSGPPASSLPSRSNLHATRSERSTVRLAHILPHFRASRTTHGHSARSQVLSTLFRVPTPPSLPRPGS